MELFEVQQLWYVFRIVIASLCGILIGFERKNRAKEAGIRTHCVVACAAALMMIVSKYAFFDVIGKGMYGGVEVRLDPSRVASTIASGIGFLGAGMIFIHKNTVTGLTTAAGIWATSGVGMAIGAGMYVIGISTTAIIIFVQIVLHRNFKWLKHSNSTRLIVNNIDMPNFQDYITTLLGEHNIIVHDAGIEKVDGLMNYSFVIELPQTTCEDAVMQLIDYDCKITANV